MTNHGSIDVDVTIDGVVNGTVQEGSGGGTRNYERLTNKPQINDVELVGNKSLEDLGIVNNEQPDWEQHDTEAGDYIKNKPSIPEYLKDLESDVMHRTVTDSEIVSWNQKSKVVANPGNTSGTLSSIGIDGTNYAIQGGGGGGAVNDVKVNETSVVDSQGVANIDLTGYATTSDIPTDLADLQDDSTHRLVTDTEKAGWDAKADTSDIPTVNNSTIIIQKNGQNVDTFTLNQNADKTIDISVPTKTSDLQNDSSFITNTVSNLANYYLKSETYTKTEVSNLIDAAVNGRFEKVQTLPVTGEANVIYLVPKTTALTNNVYDEYIWQDNAWEQLGSTEIDLSGYVTDTDLATALADYVTTSAFNTAIANYYTKTEVGNLLDDKVDKVSGKGLSTNDYDNTAKGIVDGVTVALADKVDKVAGKGLSTNDYTTAEKNKVATIDNKADKVSSATNGNLAGLNGSGNLTDSGWNGAKDTTSISDNPISISGLKSNQLAVNPIITFEPIQAGSGTPSPSNIRAISGYDKIEVLSCGKNIIGEIHQGTRSTSTGAIDSASTVRVISDFVFAKQTAYTVSATSLVSGKTINVVYYEFTSNGDGTYHVTYDSGWQSVPYTFTPSMSRNDVVMCAMFRFSDNSTISPSSITAQLEEGTSATTYVPYVKTTDLSESLGQTVYKGSLDVRTGLFTVTHKAIDMGDVTWGTSGGTCYYTNIADKVDGVGGLICSAYENAGNVGFAVANGKIGESVVSSYLKTIFVGDTRGMSASEFQTTLSGQKIVYTLATPFTIQLTPHEISLLKDYAYVSTNGTNIALDYHNGELASLADVSQLGETVNELGKATTIYSKTSSRTSDAYGLMQIKSNDTDLPSNAVMINAFVAGAYLFGNRAYGNKIECVLCGRDSTILANATVDVTVLYILR